MVRGLRGGLHGLTGALDAAHLALGAVRDLGHGGGDLRDGAAGLVGRGGHLLRGGGDRAGALGELGDRARQLRAHRVVGLDGGDRVVADRADGLGDVADLVVGGARSGGVTGVTSTVRSPSRRVERVAQVGRAALAQQLIRSRISLTSAGCGAANQNAIAKPITSAAPSRSSERLRLDAAEASIATCSASATLTLESNSSANSFAASPTAGTTARLLSAYASAGLPALESASTCARPSR